MSDIKLETRYVGEIKGKFLVPSYQRGYRWGEDEVVRLLEDIYTNGDKNYCLQPIVVKDDGSQYELIDGQQRLTTLYIIFKYIRDRYESLVAAIDFSLVYQTREKSASFLDNINEADSTKNIDFYFIYKAYLCVDKWFADRVAKGEKHSIIAFHLYTFFCEKVKVIWYEVDKDADAISLFTRLNIGKIPLTSAELVKAMFLCRDGNVDMDEQKQEEVSLQWDYIERQLHNDSLWYFLANAYKTSYATRIDLVLDLISGKKENEREKYFTFFYFDELHKEYDLNKIWEDVQHYFLTLKDWFENHELYHKIGYLIASNCITLIDIFNLSKGKTKTEFKGALDDLISKSICIDGNFGELSYERASDRDQIKNCCSFSMWSRCGRMGNKLNGSRSVNSNLTVAAA